MPKKGHIAQLPPEFEVDPTARGEHESGESFSLFQTYLGIGPKRTTKAVSSLAEVEQSHATVRGLCSKYHWVARARAYDTVMAKASQQGAENVTARRAEELARRRVSIEDESWTLASEVIEVARKMLNMPLLETTESKDGKKIVIKPTKWSMGNVSQLLTVAQQLQALGTGVAPTGMDEGVMREFCEGVLTTLEDFVDEKSRDAVAQRLALLAENIEQREVGRLHTFPNGRAG